MLSTYLQVGDVLRGVRQCHEQRADFYADLSHKTDKENLRMYLGYMSRSEKNMAGLMAEFCESASPKVLKTWMQYGPNFDLLAVPDGYSGAQEVATDDVVDLSLEQADRLATFYAEAAQFADIHEVRELFIQLKAQEDAEKADIAKNALFLKRDM